MAPGSLRLSLNYLSRVPKRFWSQCDGFCTRGSTVIIYTLDFITISTNINTGSVEIYFQRPPLKNKSWTAKSAIYTSEGGMKMEFCPFLEQSETNRVGIKHDFCKIFFQTISLTHSPLFWLWKRLFFGLVLIIIILIVNRWFIFYHSIDQESSKWPQWGQTKQYT